MAAYDFRQGAINAGNAVSTYRNSTNSHWNDSYLDMGAKLMAADMANAHELEMWNLNNAYNTPTAQMQRMKEAGLNPMLFYSQGNPGNSSSAPGTHAANPSLSPHADTLNRIQGVLGILGAFNSMISQSLGVADQGMDLQMKQNDLDWSNYQNSIANHFLLGYGQGRSAKQFGFLGNVRNAFDPFARDFDPSAFSLMNRMGVTGYYPRQVTADASAKLAGERSEYQDYYNKNVLPKVKEFMEGKVSIQEIEKSMMEYEDKALDSLPPQVRGVLKPILDLLKLIMK